MLFYKMGYGLQLTQFVTLQIIQNQRVTCINEADNDSKIQSHVTGGSRGGGVRWVRTNPPPQRQRIFSSNSCSEGAEFGHFLKKNPRMVWRVKKVIRFLGARKWTHSGQSWIRHSWRCFISRSVIMETMLEFGVKKLSQEPDPQTSYAPTDTARVELAPQS